MTPGAGEFGEPPQGIRTLTPTPIHVEEAVLDDLRRRLSSVRWPVDAGNDDEYYGVSRTRLEPLVEYWRDEYDRRRAEAEINRFEHYFVQVGQPPGGSSAAVTAIRLAANAPSTTASRATVLVATCAALRPAVDLADPE